MKRVLVTGGAGFIGSHVVDKLANAGYEPVIYDLRHSPFHEEGSVETVIGDLCDTDQLCHALRGCSAVVHLAAAADVGIVQTERLPEIVERKNEVARDLLDPAHPNRLRLPDGMTSGLYKYIVFDEIERSTGKVYEDPCHRIMETGDDLPNTDWIGANHWCVPLYYAPAEEAVGAPGGTA